MRVLSPAHINDIALPSSASKTRRPLQEAITRPVVLLFHPGVGMGLLFRELRGCTSQMCTVNDHLRELHDFGATIYGVSTLPVEPNSRFSTEHDLSFELLSDTTGALDDVFSIGKKRYGDKDFYERAAVVVCATHGDIVFSVLPDSDPSMESIIKGIRQVSAVQ
mgnify:CR=1 FL=1